MRGPYPTVKYCFCPSAKSWGQVATFYLSRWDWKPPMASYLHNFHIGYWISTINHLRRCPWTPHFPHAAYIKEIMPDWTVAFLGATPKSLLIQGVVLRQRPTQNAISPSSHLRLRYSWANLESGCHKLRITYGLSLVTLSLHGQVVFPKLGALIHTRITWAPSPTTPQVPSVTSGSPLGLWCFGHFIWRCAQQTIYTHLWLDLTYLILFTTIGYTRARPFTIFMIFELTSFKLKLYFSSPR